MPGGPISVVVMGCVTEALKFTSYYKFITISVTEFVETNNMIIKFPITCKYSYSDTGIDDKIINARKDLNVIITGELNYFGSEFVIDIQDVDYLSTSHTNIETSLSPYMWPTSKPLEGISLQTMTDTTDQNDNEPMDE